MLVVQPDYYSSFHCIAGECRHSCCIGWEIDIDPASAARYAAVPGALGQRLQRCISPGPEPYFLLDEKERCPFLNKDNLCDLILELGEEALCGICADHPRFRNELPGRLEQGLGLCCEEAARLILTQAAPMRLVYTGRPDPGCPPDAILLLRDEVLRLLQDRRRPIGQRVCAMLQLTGHRPMRRSVRDWAEIFLSLEQMDPQWTALLQLLREHGDEADTAAFDRFMAGRQTEYEQFLVYLVYRHFANAPDEDEAALRADFAALGYGLLRTLGAVLWQRDDDFTLAQQLELARLFSAEIEYCDENRCTLLDFLAG